MEADLVLTSWELMSIAACLEPEVIQGYLGAGEGLDPGPVGSNLEPKSMQVWHWSGLRAWVHRSWLGTWNPRSKIGLSQ